MHAMRYMHGGVGSISASGYWPWEGGKGIAKIGVGDEKRYPLCINGRL